MGRDILIFGAGGHGRVVWDAIQTQGLYRAVAFVVDQPDAGTYLGLPLVAQAEVAMLDVPKGIIAIGDNHVRAQTAEAIMREFPAFEFVTIVHPRSTIGRNVHLADGAVILANAVVNSGAKVGPHGVVNTSAVVEHDCVMGAFSTVAPNAALAGNVSVGDRAYVGIGACVIQNLAIGADTLVGAGSVVVRDLPAGVVAFGNPCRVIHPHSVKK
jgi:sugar O-acyltransferase (sialic acid O-acetyltransferase NeuD family)